MKKELPKENWVQLLSDFAIYNEGSLVSLYTKSKEGERQIGENNLIAFEGDCDGEIVNGVKIVIGGEGESPKELVHYVKSPVSISYEENEEKGTVDKLTLISQDEIKTILESIGEDLVL